MKIALPNNTRQGVVIVYVIVLLIILLLFCSLAVDISNIQMVKTQLRAAVDAATLNAASGLADGPAEVRKRAKASALANLVNGKGLVLMDSDIQLGNWTASGFSVATGAAESTATAVKITARLNGERDSAIKLFFAGIVGKQTKDLTLSSVAGGSSAGADVVIVQDITSSFSDELADAKTADLKLIDSLYASGAGTSSIGVVTHTGWGQTMLALKPVKTNYSLLKSTVTNIKHCGNKGMPKCSGTDISAGLLEGTKVFTNASSQNGGAAKVIVLVSDGEPTSNSQGSNPTLNSTQLFNLAKQRSDEAWAKGIHVYVVFFNRDNSKSAADRLAQLPRGKGDFVQTADAGKLSSILEALVKRLPVQLLE